MKPTSLRSAVLIAFDVGLRPCKLEKKGFEHGTSVRLRSKIIKLGLTREAVEAMPPKKLHEMIYPKPRPKSDSLDENGEPIRIQPDIPAIYQELKNQEAAGGSRSSKKLELTRELLFDELYYNNLENLKLADRGKQFLSRNTLYHKLQKYIDEHTARSSRKEHEFGKELQIDFTGVQLPYGDKENPQKATFLVDALPASGYIYMQAIASQKIEDVMDAITDCFKSLGGVTDVLRVDNFKAAITEAGNYGGETTADMDALARILSFEIYNCRVRHAKDKGCVEACVKSVTRYPLALANRHINQGGWFETLKELNDFIAPRVDKLNNRTVRGMIQSRKERFEIEKKFLHQPSTWDVGSVKSYNFTVPPTLTFTYNEHGYVVSPDWEGTELSVEISRDMVRFIFGNAVVESYPRRDGVKSKSAKPGYLDKKEETFQIYSIRNQEPMLIKWAGSIGPDVEQWTMNALKSKVAFNDKIRRIVKILSLSQGFIERNKQLNDSVAELVRRRSLSKIGAHQIIKAYEKLNLSNDNRADLVHCFDNYLQAGRDVLYGKCTVMHWPEGRDCQAQKAKESTKTEYLNGTEHYQKQYAKVAQTLGQTRGKDKQEPAACKSELKEEQ